MSAYLARKFLKMIKFSTFKSLATLLLREGCRKKMRQKYGLLPNQGEGGSPRVIKNQTPFLEKYFFSELVESF